MKNNLFFLAAILFLLLASCVTKGAAQAEEYFTIGMAYFEMGKFTDAEMWLNRARAADKTMVASDYNLGRIAFETGRFEEAAKIFEKILDSDPDNTMVLRAAAYSRIRNGDIEKAETLYDRVLKLVPESADDGYNYALVLYGLDKFDDCEKVLNNYPIALEEKAPSILLLARAQNANGKVEAVDTYAKWLIVNTGTINTQGLYEYASVLEGAGFYARALEQYDAAIEAHTKDTVTLKRNMLLFGRARLLLTVDPENEDGMAELNRSINEGFKDIEAIEKLVEDERITQYNREEIRRILDNLEIPEENEDAENPETEDESDTEI